MIRSPRAVRDEQHLPQGENGLRQGEPHGDLTGRLIRQHFLRPVTRARRSYDRARDRALPPPDSIAFIRGVLKEFRGS
ncbi:hypothetical protein [Streptomyces sp. WA6-1-16]|uniref:hypothetical protein n=1 Tax=Streptomyces sp. WA6-1-16 TaxID=2879427 RepID=UPI00268F5B32